MSCKGTMKWLGGLFTGVAIGAAAGLLLAPKSGEETRAEINDGIQETFYDAYDAVLNLGDRLLDQIEDLKADFSEWSSKVKDESALDLDDEEACDLEGNNEEAEEEQMTETETEISEDENAEEIESSEKIEEEEEITEA